MSATIVLSIIIIIFFIIFIFLFKKIKNKNRAIWIGGIMGGVYAIMFFIFNLFFDLSYLALIWFPMILITQLINLLFTGNSLRSTSISILFGYIIFILLSIVVGVLIGYIITKIRGRNNE